MEISSFRKKDLIPATIWIILGGLIMIGAYNLDLGNFRTPGPGMFPFLLGTVLIFVTLPVLFYSLKDVKQWRRKEASIWVTTDFWRIGMVLFILLAYGFILERVGFSVTTFLCLFFLFKVVGPEKASRALVWAIATVISAYLLFITALKVYMPPFPWSYFVDVFFFK